jgi:hypothetical protein
MLSCILAFLPDISATFQFVSFNLKGINSFVPCIKPIIVHHFIEKKSPIKEEKMRAKKAKDLLLFLKTHKVSE